MREWKQRRTWKAAHVKTAGSGFEIFLDKEKLLTPQNAPIVVPTKKLADVLAAEWEKQKETIQFTSMPFTKLVYSSIDNVKREKNAVVSLLVEYGDTDLLFYRAEDPADLKMLQEKSWNPILDWGRKVLSVDLNVTYGIRYIEQDQREIRKLRKLLEEFSDFELAGLHELVVISGSLLIGLALKRKYLSFKKAWESSILDEKWQMKKWGADQESLDRLLQREHEFRVAFDFLTLLSD